MFPVQTKRIGMLIGQPTQQSMLPQTPTKNTITLRKRGARLILASDEAPTFARSVTVSVLVSEMR